MTLNKWLFALFIISLPACYYTIVPSILLFTMFMVLRLEDDVVNYLEMIQKAESNAEYHRLKKELEELQTQVSRLNLKAGFRLE